MDGSNQWSNMGQGPGLMPCSLGDSKRCCNEKAGVATSLLLALEAPSEVTCNSREWLNCLQTALLFESAYWILLTGKEAYGDSAPNLASSIHCPKWRWIQASRPAAGRGGAGRCVGESDMAAEEEG